MLALVDTNVLVYAYDPRSAAKQAKAIALLDELVGARQAVLSVQCLSEFYAVVTTRLREPLAPAAALERVERLARACRVIDLTPAVALEGVRGAARHKRSVWDSLIWAAAKLHQVPYVLTEDAKHGSTVEGVRYLDPFAAAFDVRALVEGA